MTVSANNNFNEKISVPVQLNIQAPITKLNIRHKGTIKDQPSIFHAPTYSGSEKFYDWDFGDGTTLQNMSVMEANHTYKR